MNRENPDHDHIDPIQPTTVEPANEAVPIETVLLRARPPRIEEVIIKDGLVARVEAGTEPKIINREIGRMAVTAAQFFKRKTRIDALNIKQKGFSDDVKKFAADHPGFRGLISRQHNLSLSVYPSYNVEWDHDQLEKSLGEPIYRSVVTEDKLVASVAIPNGYETEKGPIDSQALREAFGVALHRIGLSDLEIDALLTTTVVASVNEDALAEVLKKESIKLLPGVAKVIRIWNLRVTKHQPNQSNS